MLLRSLLCLNVVLFSFAVAQGGYLIEIDIDGADDDILELNDDFDFGGDTTSASQSSPSRAFGMTGGDSFFGGNGIEELDTYSFFYKPEEQADNLTIDAGADLGGGNTGTGLVGGGPGTYRIYATWPWTDNVTGGMTKFVVTTEAEEVEFELDQNGRGHSWFFVGDVEYEEGEILVDQIAGENTFVSMRSAGILFELQGDEVVCVPSTGDIDGSGTVDFADFLVLSANFGTEGTQADGDLDCNNQIDFADFLVLSSNFGKPAAAAVPEPSASIIALFALAILPLMRKRS